jgi:two-component system cell cycle response regulator DivK
VSTPCVLIVDDNAINIELASFVLDAAGFKVESVQDPTLALAHVARSRPDLILMDIQMPGIDGLELTRRLKSDPATRDIVVVAFTAYAMKGDKARLRSAGCDAYLSKPIDVATFAQTVRSHLGGGAGVPPVEPG